MVHSWSTSPDDSTVDPRWGKVGKQKIEDAGQLCPKRMETVDDEIQANAFQVSRQAEGRQQAVLPLAESDAHASSSHTFRQSMRRCGHSKNGWTISEAGMAQLDDIVGATMQKLKDLGVDENTIVVFTTDNGTEVFTWPDGGQTPFAQSKGTVMEGGFRAPAMIRWPGHVPAGTGGKRTSSLASDWFPTLLTAAGNPNITEQLLKG